MLFTGFTDKGISRSMNQDCFVVEKLPDLDAVILLVCDGMGGANAGNVASSLARDIFLDAVRGRLNADTTFEDVSVCVKDAVIQANDVIHKQGISDPDYAGMGTTLVAAIAFSDGRTVVVNVGDSRAYHISKYDVDQITRDHSVVEDMIEKGEITRKESRAHPNKNLITKAIGTCEDIEPDVFTLKLTPGEHIMLCSDGLSNMLYKPEIMFEIRRADTLDESCQGMLDIALSRGAPDNVTAVLLKL